MAFVSAGIYLFSTEPWVVGFASKDHFFFHEIHKHKYDHPWLLMELIANKFRLSMDRTMILNVLHMALIIE